jgi:hypothetical protein
MPPVHQSQAEDASKFDQALFYQALGRRFVSRPARMIGLIHLPIAMFRK